MKPLLFVICIILGFAVLKWSNDIGLPQVKGLQFVTKTNFLMLWTYSVLQAYN